MGRIMKVCDLDSNNNIEGVFLTGSTSMVGLALIRECIYRYIKVTALVRPNSPRVERIPKSDLIKIIDCDLDKIGTITNIDESMFPIDVFFHIGWANNERKHRNSCEAQFKNIQYTIDAVHLAKKIGCKRFVGLGGQDEYGVVSTPLKNKIPVDPITPTGITKYAAGKYSEFECERLGLEYIWIRLLSVYGIFDHEDRLLKSFINNCQKNIPMSLTECSHIWDYLYEDDVGRALFMIGEKGVDGKVYTLGSGIGKPLKKYLEIIRKLVNPDYTPGYGKIPYNEKSVRYLCADISELSRDTGWRPQISFEDGIRRIIAKT